MVITNPEIKRLNYVERELSLLNDSHLAKVVHNVIENIKSSPEYVYILAIETPENYITECFANFQEAVNRMTHHIKNAEILFQDKFPDEQIQGDSKQVYPEQESAYYSIWRRGNRDTNYIVIKIKKEEVK